MLFDLIANGIMNNFCRDIVKDMKIDRENTFSDKSRADRVRSILQRKDFRSKERTDSRIQMRTMPLHPRKTEKYVLHIIIKSLHIIWNGHHKSG